MIPFSTIWTEFQGDSANSGYAALNTGPAKDHKWTAPAPSPGGGSPIVNPLDGAIYVADGVGQYRDNGVALWTRSGGTNDQWGSTPATEARKNKNFNTPGCKTGGLKTYLSPGSAFYFQSRRGTLRQIPGLHKAIYGKPSSFRLQIPLFCGKGNWPVAITQLKLNFQIPSKF
jgi:hypothetical protein